MLLIEQVLAMKQKRNFDLKKLLLAVSQHIPRTTENIALTARNHPMSLLPTTPAGPARVTPLITRYNHQPEPVHRKSTIDGYGLPKIRRHNRRHDPQYSREVESSDESSYDSTPDENISFRMDHAHQTQTCVGARKRPA